MKTTLGWLKTHLDTEASLAAIVQTLVMSGLEVESVENRAKDLAPFIIGRIIEARPHPNADRLKLCRVDTGQGEVEVVCGAPNARGGLVGVFAPPGTVIPRNGMVLKASQIRGVQSNGMLCSGYELKLSEDREGIIELPEALAPGTPFATAMGLDDPVLDVKVTPNRADCLGVRGLARDLAAAGLGRLKPLEATPVAGKFPSPITVRLDGPDRIACPLFLGRLIRGVRNGPSPRWLQDRLTAIGLRPISALVDITNFLTYDLDRPLHVFDAGKLQGDLVLRGALPGETLEALNGKSYALDPEMTVIADQAGAQSLGGVIGGMRTGCTETTRDVFIEAALFDPVRTAATGRKLGLQSDARYRFERGVDPEFTAPGMEIATRLILELCGGEPSAVTAAGEVPHWRRHYHLRENRVESLGGVVIAPGDQRRILEALGCKLESASGGFSVEPPSWRGDIEGEADLVEEILRIRGYDAIPAVPLVRDTALPKPALSPAQRRVALVRRSLAARGLTEAVTFSFMAKAQAELFEGGGMALTLANPISAELDAMRPSVLPNLLTAAQRNADRGYPNGALFEIGPLYKDDTPEGQWQMATGIRAGRTGVKRWDDPGQTVDAFLAKADASAALAAAGVAIDGVQVASEAPAWYHPGRSGTLRQGNKPLAHFGELHPGVLDRLGVAGPAVGFEVFLDAVPAPRARQSRARPLLALSPFQPVERDFAFVVEESVAAETVLRAARGVDRKLVVEVRLFDVYRGKGVEDGKKSLAITVVLQPQEATLTEDAIDAFSKRLIAAVEKASGGRLRG
ncbi:MAG: phenylalanine--tRNA ligase subunit beta [Stellaceae bacterium]